MEFQAQNGCRHLRTGLWVLSVGWKAPCNLGLGRRKLARGSLSRPRLSSARILAKAVNILSQISGLGSGKIYTKSCSPRPSHPGRLVLARIGLDSGKTKSSARGALTIGVARPHSDPWVWSVGSHRPGGCILGQVELYMLFFSRPFTILALVSGLQGFVPRDRTK